MVPIEEVDHWLDLEPAVAAHLTGVAQAIGKALHAAYKPLRVGMMIAGLEVPHVHLHLVPIWGVHDLDFSNAARNPDPGDLDAAADTIRKSLRELGYEQVVDPD